MPTIAATSTKAKVYLQMKIAAAFPPSRIAPPGSPPSRCPTKAISEEKSFTIITLNSATMQNITINNAVETISLEVQTCPLSRASRSFFSVGISVFSPVLSSAIENHLQGRRCSTGFRIAPSLV